MKFGISFIYEATLSKPTAGKSVEMESIRLIEAQSMADVKRLAVEIGLKDEHSYENDDDVNVEWQLRGIKLFEVIDSNDNDESLEVFSRFFVKGNASQLIEDCDWTCADGWRDQHKQTSPH